MTSSRPSFIGHAVRTAAFAALAPTLLAACMVGPEFARPSPPASTHYDVQAEHDLAGDASASGKPHVDLNRAIDGHWWSVFGSKTLDDVMRRAIAGNLDLDAADASIAQADEAAVAAGGALKPRVDFDAQAGRQRGGSLGAHTGNVYSVGPRVAFDFDLFGGTKRQVEEREALATLQRHRYDAAWLTVTGDVATQAILLASARAQIDAVRALIANDRRNLELVRTAHRYGSATQVDIALATNQLAQDETLLPPLAQQRDAARHALSILAGRGPADWIPPDFELADFTLPATLPVSLPSELARTRPDILEAEARLHAASAAIGVATADLYPRLQLSAALTQTGPGPASLWGIAAALTGPIFHGGELQANRRGAVDGYKAAFAAYRQTVIVSLGQVADVLQAIDHDGDEYAAQTRALDAADTGARLSRAGYGAGETSVLQVLDAERAYQRALIGQIRARTAQYLDTTELAVALGGNAGGAFERRVATADAH